MASSVFEVLFISKSLERVCDHAVNISKEIFFIATSRDVRHAPEYKKAALRRDLK
jgi:phosphate uptake regulator